METIKNKNVFKVCEVETIYKSKVKASERPTIKSSKDAFEVIKSFIDLDEQEHKERVYMILMNKANKVLGIQKIGDGAISGCVIDVRLVFQTALKTNATGFILWHNHPSGRLQPSEADKDITRKLKNGARILDFSFLDHLIIDSEGNFYSMADSGLM
jgi:DNA repair protein RadC